MNYTFRNLPPKTTTRAEFASSFILKKNSWDDYGHKVTYDITFLDRNSQEQNIGQLKILQQKAFSGEQIATEMSTKLPSTFSELNTTFISIGQSEDYYKRLRELFSDDAGAILHALNDIAWRPHLADSFETSTAFRNALLRNNGAQRARKFGRALALGQSFTEQLEFKYIGKIDGADQPFEIAFGFDGKDALPGRVIGIIGRNAVGKTRLLASLGEDLAQISRTSAEKLAERERRFPNGRPLFNRVITISYSAFDKFKRPPSDDSHSYIYCGIRNDRGGISQATLMETYLSNQARIRNRDRGHEWTKHVQMILGDLSNGLTADPEHQISSTENDDSVLPVLSSGQSILCHFVTALLAWIQPNTLVLFDEPETHLHPNAVASLFLVLHDILGNYDSYAIVATHSPVVIQEIPSKRVIVLRRTGNVTLAEPLQLESFGESVSELTRHVFETVEIKSLYRQTLKELSMLESADSVLSRFDKGLSLSAQAYLLAQYGRHNS